MPDATCTPAAVGSCYEWWYRHFVDKRDWPCALPWNDAYLLRANQRELVARSIQQLQSGEWARGRGLVRRASLHGGGAMAATPRCVSQGGMGFSSILAAGVPRVCAIGDADLAVRRGMRRGADAETLRAKAQC